MVCEVCLRDLPHGRGEDHCLTYGGRVMCGACVPHQPICTICGKRRMGVHMTRDGVCEECSARRRIEELFVTTRTVMPEEDEVEVLDPPPPIFEEPERKGGLCKICGEYHKRLTEYRGVPVCRKCIPSVGRCQVCGKVSFRVNHYCRECTKKEGIGIEHNWRYRAKRFKKWGFSKDKLYIGVENEVQVDTRKLAYINHIARSYFFDEAYTMYDGTIEYGTEVVFHPRTLESWKSFDLDPSLTNVIPHGGTGMHVHLSREAFINKLHLYKFMRFFAKNKKYIEFIAERKAKMFRAWEFTKEGEVLAKCKGYDVGENKYIDVNLKHPTTIEVRIFKGATKSSQILKNIEFCHALWAFSKEIVPKKMTKFQFERWLRKQDASKYPNLTKFINQDKEIS